MSLVTTTSTQILIWILVATTWGWACDEREVGYCMQHICLHGSRRLGAMCHAAHIYDKNRCFVSCMHAHFIKRSKINADQIWIWICAPLRLYVLKPYVRIDIVDCFRPFAFRRRPIFAFLVQPTTLNRELVRQNSESCKFLVHNSPRLCKRFSNLKRGTRKSKRVHRGGNDDQWKIQGILV